jgi:hypothetical protein
MSTLVGTQDSFAKALCSLIELDFEYASGKSG